MFFFVPGLSTGLPEFYSGSTYSARVLRGKGSHGDSEHQGFYGVLISTVLKLVCNANLLALEAHLLTK